MSGGENQAASEEASVRSSVTAAAAAHTSKESGSKNANTHKINKRQGVEW